MRRKFFIRNFGKLKKISRETNFTPISTIVYTKQRYYHVADKEAKYCTKTKSIFFWKLANKGRGCLERPQERQAVFCSMPTQHGWLWSHGICLTFTSWLSKLKGCVWWFTEKDCWFSCCLQSQFLPQVDIRITVHTNILPEYSNLCSTLRTDCGWIF